MFSYILFDLDGTISDPKEGITKSVQYALQSFGIYEPDLNRLTPFIGPPLRDSFMQFYGFSPQQAQAAEEQFDLVFKKHEIPDDIPEFAADLTPNDEGKVYLAKLIVDAGLAGSAGEARRLIDGGGVKINGEPVAAKSYNVDPALLESAILQVGKRKFAKLV